MLYHCLTDEFDLVPGRLTVQECGSQIRAMEFDGPWHDVDISMLAHWVEIFAMSGQCLLQVITVVIAEGKASSASPASSRAAETGCVKVQSESSAEYQKCPRQQC